MKKFIYGTFSYDYILEKQDRKTLSLTVKPDLELVLKCPRYASEERIEAFLRRKWLWLEKQIKFFKELQNGSYIKEYISGESFYYLGRQYKLIVKHSDCDNVSLNKGVVFLSTTKSVADGRYNKKLLNQWYKEKMDKVFTERFKEMQKRFNYKKMPELGVRKMKKRWGSYLTNKKIFLNPKLIQVSKNCIDYVIVHELCHMKYKNHDTKFFTLLETKYTNWKRVKKKLESNQ